MMSVVITWPQSPRRVSEVSSTMIRYRCSQVPLRIPHIVHRYLSLEPTPALVRDGNEVTRLCKSIADLFPLLSTIHPSRRSNFIEHDSSRPHAMTPALFVRLFAK